MIRHLVPAALAATVVASAIPIAGAAPDPATGKRVYARCSSCHLLDASGRSTIGPNLYGVVGRRAGTVPKFRYSPALTKAALSWTPEQLDAYLANPRKAVPGTNMAFPGIASPADRAELIAYLKATR